MLVESAACRVSKIAITAMIGITTVTSAVTVISIISEIAVIHTAVAAIDMHTHLRRFNIPDTHIIGVEYILDIVDRMRLLQNRRLSPRRPPPMLDYPVIRRLNASVTGSLAWLIPGIMICITSTPPTCTLPHDNIPCGVNSREGIREYRTHQRVQSHRATPNVFSMSPGMIS